MRLLESVVQDVRFAVRQLRRSPGFALVGVTAIAIGIAANSTIFSFLGAIYLRTLPVRHAHRLVAISADDARSRDNARLTATEFAHCREHASSFSGLAAQDRVWMWLSDGERSVEWEGGRVLPTTSMCWASRRDLAASSPPATRSWLCSATRRGPAPLMAIRRCWAEQYD
jgi:hypothetical protein